MAREVPRRFDVGTEVGEAVLRIEHATPAAGAGVDLEDELDVVGGGGDPVRGVELQTDLLGRRRRVAAERVDRVDPAEDVRARIARRGERIDLREGRRAGLVGIDRTVEGVADEIDDRVGMIERVTAGGQLFAVEDTIAVGIRDERVRAEDRRLVPVLEHAAIGDPLVPFPRSSSSPLTRSSTVRGDRSRPWQLALARPHSRPKRSCVPAPAAV
ncbi:MAG: hypothetical protein H6748_04280 [Spirochaetaceae bacterium]|nr:hypothetical protein [Myxococcales bacterium]MCB9723249.1 hypothetical protein [Spirochaetaceae bacterium]HPG25461.1 hypothetical protein [Myxococcota bacterium]